MSDAENKMTGQVTLMIYRIAIGPLLLLMVGWIWNQQKAISRLTEENRALFGTAARLEQWARESRRQAAYLEGMKDTIVSGTTGPQEVKISLKIPQKEVKEHLATLEEQQEEDRSFIEQALANIREMTQDESEEELEEAEIEEAEAEVEDTAELLPNSPPQQLQQQSMPDYDEMPEISPEELERYRATKTRGVK